MTAKYHLKQASNGQFVFTLHAPNGRVLLTSERYTDKEDALSGIEAARQFSGTEQRYQRTFNHDGEPFFVLRNPQRQTIGTSERFSNWNALDVATTAAIRYGPKAPMFEIAADPADEADMARLALHVKTGQA